MDQVHVIRHKVLAEDEAIRKVARDLGVSRNTVRKYVEVSEPARVEAAPRRRPVFERVRSRIDALLSEWRERTTRKQRITGTRLVEVLRGEGLSVGTTLVRAYLREVRRRSLDVYVPLVHRSGDEAQVDFFEVTVVVGGAPRKAWLFLLRLMYSGRDFAWLYPRADQVCFLDGHVRGFAALGGAPRRCVYDNLAAAVRRLLGLGRFRATRQDAPGATIGGVGGPVTSPPAGGPAGLGGAGTLGLGRALTERFAALASHYAFEPCFARPGEGHDKGGVESRGKTLRWQHLVPMPEGDSLEAISEALNRSLEAAAVDRKDACGRSVAERFAEERAQLTALPAVPFEARKVLPVTVRSTSLVQVEGAWYSVPSRWARLDATVSLGVSDVRILCLGETVTHPRQPFGGREIRYRHYLPELSRKPQAVRQVAPELLAELGEPYGRLWALLVATHGELEGARVLARVLGAIVDHGEGAVTRAVEETLTTERVDLLSLARLRAAEAPPSVPVPAALAAYTVESARAADYDEILSGGSHE